MIVNIYPTGHFKKAYKQLPQKLKDRAKQKEEKFIAAPFDPSINTHRLKGKLKNYWTYSVNYTYRIMFRFINRKLLSVFTD